MGHIVQSTMIGYSDSAGVCQKCHCIQWVQEGPFWGQKISLADFYFNWCHTNRFLIVTFVFYRYQKVTMKNRTKIGQRKWESIPIQKEKNTKKFQFVRGGPKKLTNLQLGWKSEATADRIWQIRFLLSAAAHAWRTDPQSKSSSGDSGDDGGRP